jgi:hypothetical protein
MVVYVARLWSLHAICLALARHAVLHHVDMRHASVCVCEAHAGCKRYLAILKYVMLMGLPASHVHGCGPRGVSGRLLAMNEVSSLVEVSKSGAARRGVGVDCRSQVAGPERWELGRTCWLGRTRADGSRPAAA